MPVLTRRQQTLAPRKLNNIQPSIESNNAPNEVVWAVDDEFEQPQSDFDFPLAPLGKVASRKDSMNNLRIQTYTSSDLHDRYMSDEEEPSPSPADSETESNDSEELLHKTPAAPSTQAAEPIIYEEYKAEIAIAVPILAMGRPKLVDITNIAPMHKRKRIEKPMLSRSAFKNAASRSQQPVINENTPFVAQEATKVLTPDDPRPPKRQDSLPMQAPNSWLPDDVTVVGQEEDHYFPDLELRNPPTYNDYDPYSLSPPRLSPRNSYNSESGTQPGSVARARNSSISPNAINNVRKGINRTLSMAKSKGLHRGDHQITKKPKMLARPANEREEPFMLPKFPLIERDSQ